MHDGYTVYIIIHTALIVVCMCLAIQTETSAQASRVLGTMVLPLLSQLGQLLAQHSLMVQTSAVGIKEQVSSCSVPRVL